MKKFCKFCQEEKELASFSPRAKGKLCVTTPEFIHFTKMSRLSREVIVSEKIDGSNAQVYIDDAGQMFFGSRNRWLTLDNDNYGFCAWGERNREELLKLGPGRHYGEFWGAGIQRRYGLAEKRFSLFNVQRWIYTEAFRFNEKQEILPACCHVVPILYRGMFDTSAIRVILHGLALNGSAAAPGFKDPEGIVVFHIAAGIGFKKTIKDDESPKSLVK